MLGGSYRPYGRTFLLDLSVGTITTGRKDLNDIYGPGLEGPDTQAAIQTWLGAAYEVFPGIHVGLRFGSITKKYSVSLARGVSEDFYLPIAGTGIFARFGSRLPSERGGDFLLTDSLSMFVTAAYVSYTFSGARLANSLFSGQLNLSGGGNGGYLDVGTEARWKRFGLSLTVGYHMVEISPVYAEGTIGGLAIPRFEFPTQTGVTSHFDYSGLSIRITTQLYVGGRV